MPNTWTWHAFAMIHRSNVARFKFCFKLVTDWSTSISINRFPYNPQNHNISEQRTTLAILSSYPLKGRSEDMSPEVKWLAKGHAASRHRMRIKPKTGSSVLECFSKIWRWATERQLETEGHLRCYLAWCLGMRYRCITWKRFSWTYTENFENGLFLIALGHSQ